MISCQTGHLISDFHFDIPHFPNYNIIYDKAATLKKSVAAYFPAYIIRNQKYPYIMVLPVLPVLPILHIR